MSRTAARFGVIGVVAVGSSLLVALPATTAQGVTAADPVTVTYEMNEPPGSRVITAEGGAGPDGYIGEEVVVGSVFDGATGYTFPRLQPNTPPPHPEHLVKIPDDPRLDADGGLYSVEIRYRTTNKFGNLIQKGQSKTPGGQFKIQLPRGEPVCNYKGSAGRVVVRWRTPIDDGQWHTLKCSRVSDGVQLFVDGVLRQYKKGPIGVFNNSFPLTIGGKPKCDQVEVTCDYFGGQVDWVRLTKG